MRIEAGLLLTYAKVTGPGLQGPGPVSGGSGSGEEQSRLEMGVPSAIRTATELFGLPAGRARSAAGTTPVRNACLVRL